MLHPLHQLIGGMILDAGLSGYKVLRDPACGGDQHLPLFCSEIKSRGNEYCNVDLLILESDDPGHERVKVIVEIEEANVKPLQVFGKFFSCAVSQYFIHERKHNAAIPMADSVLFAQILDTSKLTKDKTAKEDQWRNIQRSIQGVIPIKGSRFDHYRLFFGDSRDFAANGAAKGSLMDCLRSFLISQ